MMNFGVKTLVFYDKMMRIWVAVRQDSAGNQIGSAGYGHTKKEAIEDVQYQSEIEKAKSARR